MSCGGKKAAGGVLGWLLPGDEFCDVLMTQPAHVVAREALPDGDVVAVPPPVQAPLIGARAFTRVLERDWWLHSFSRLAEGSRHDAPELPGAAADEALAPEPVTPLPAMPDVPGWPRGARYGNAVHAILEETDFAAWRDAATAPPGEHALLERQLRAAGYGGDDELDVAQAATARLVVAALNAPILPDLRLADLPESARRAELEFHFGIAGAGPARLLELLHAHGYQRDRRDFARLHGSLRGLMNGIIDLVFVHAGQWWIVDYKTNHLGPTWADYAPERLPAAIAAHDYDLQYLIYTVALHRWLRQVLGDAYAYERDIGGARYLFLRGMHAPGRPGNGVFADRPPAALIEALDDLLRAPGEVAA
jgi:exodeoxyribonuclease V beta subunit